MMKTSLRMSVVAGLTAFLVSFGATAAEKTFNIGGDAEYDITNSKTKLSDSTGSITLKNTGEGGRVQIRAKARIDNDNGTFVEAVAAPRFAFTTGTNTTAGDQYIKFGKKAWDIQLGRFEAIDLFPFGKQAGRDTDVALFRADAYDSTINPLGTSLLGYQANKARGRDSSNRVQGAAHFNVGKTQVEFGAAYSDNNGLKTTGIRPVVKFDAGRFRVAAGYDLLDCSSNTANACNSTFFSGPTLALVNTANYTDMKSKGFGITAGTTIGKVSTNLNIAQGKYTGTTATGGSESTGKMTSIGLNGSVGRFGAGYIHDKTADVGKQDTFYGAYTVPLMGSKDASVTFAASTSKAKYDEDFVGVTDATAKNNQFRARFNYNF